MKRTRLLILLGSLMLSLVALGVPCSQSQGLVVVHRKAPAGGGISLIQQVVATSATGQFSADLGSLPVDGNGLIACFSYLSTDSLDGDPSLGGQGCTLAASSTVAGVTTDIWYALDIIGGDAHSEVTTAGGTRLSGNVSEWSGLANSAPVIVNNSGLASTTVDTSDVTPNVSDNLVIAIGGWTTNNYSSGPFNGFTRMTPTGGGAAFQEEAYKIQSSAVDAGTSWILTAGINWTTVIAAFDGT